MPLDVSGLEVTLVTACRNCGPYTARRPRPLRRLGTTGIEGGRNAAQRKETIWFAPELGRRMLETAIPADADGIHDSRYAGSLEGHRFRCLAL